MSGVDLKSLESVGFNGVLIIFLFGVYKLLTSRNFVSRCGWLTLDFRSASTRQKELADKHEIEMKRLEIEQLKYESEIKKNDNKYKENELSKESPRRAEPSFERGSHSKTGQCSPKPETQGTGVG